MEKSMNKSQLTNQELEQALNRIINNQTIRVSPNRKLSVKAVEDEAGLGDGTAYYYKEVVQKIKSSIADKSSHTLDVSTLENEKLRERLKKESKLKEKYREEITNLKSKLSLLAAQNNEFAISIQQYEQRVLELESNVSFIKSDA
jgi:predicted NodU family carbamoyl transferase